jgi:hypothetical protein
MVKLSQLFDKAQHAAKDVEDKKLVVEQTKAAFDAASQDLAKANAALESMRNEIHSALGGVLGPQDPRVTVSK